MPAIDDPLYFGVFDRARSVYGFAWRLGVSGTSFYMKTRHSARADLKVSLHGPKDESTASMYFAYLEIGDNPQGVAVGLRRRHKFFGAEVLSGVKHAVRVRSTWDLFAPGVPSAPPADEPRPIRKRTMAGLTQPPARGYAVDLDVYVSDNAPYWPHEQRARADNACMGPITNAAGQSLTTVAVQRRIATTPTPESALAGCPLNVEDRVRTLGTAPDPAGFLWVVEHWASRTLLRDTALLLAADPDFTASAPE